MKGVWSPVSRKGSAVLTGLMCNGVDFWCRVHSVTAHTRPALRPGWSSRPVANEVNLDDMNWASQHLVMKEWNVQRKKVQRKSRTFDLRYCNYQVFCVLNFGKKFKFKTEVNWNYWEYWPLRQPGRKTPSCGKCFTWHSHTHKIRKVPSVFI